MSQAVLCNHRPFISSCRAQAPVTENCDREEASHGWQRDQTAIQETQCSYGRYLAKIAYGILSNREDGDEIVNDACLKAWNSIPPNRPDSLSAYLGKITRRLAIDALRTRGRASAWPLPMPALPLLGKKAPTWKYPYVGDIDLVVHRVWASDYTGTEAEIYPMEPEHVCNQIIHSYVWSVVCTAGKRTALGVMVSSDKNKTTCAYLLLLNDWIETIGFCVRRVFWV